MKKNNNKKQQRITKFLYEIGTLRKLMRMHRQVLLTDDDKNEAVGLGIDGTPSAIIGKQIIVGAQPYDAFKVAINAALLGK